MNRDIYLREMGLGPRWRLRNQQQSPEQSQLPEQHQALPLALLQQQVLPPQQLPPQHAPASAEWEVLRTAVMECRACELCRARKQAVLGVGDVHADWLFVGEGPGADEDERGEPFVGQAGRLLDAMLDAIDLGRGENVYIANVVKCRPPGNRTPKPEEAAACAAFLQRQIELIRPKLIVALGGTAAQSLLQTETTVGALRHRLHDYQGMPLIVTYHPAYLLRSPLDKAKAWDDLCFMRRHMKGLVVG